MKKVKIGFLGCGFMGQIAHLQNYAELEECEVVAVTDVRRELAAKVASAYFIPKVYCSSAELLADPEIDAIVASQGFDNHVNTVPGVLAAGKHLLTEKPLAVYHQNGRALVECAAKYGKIHMVANHKRSDPAVERAMTVINKWKETGEAGAFRYVRLTMPPGDWVAGARSKHKPISTGEAAISFTPEQPPEGVDPQTAKRHVEFVNYYIHQVNLMRLFFGEDYNLTFADKSGALLSVQSASGVTGVIEMATFSTSDDWQETALVCFEKGYVYVELPPPLASQRAGKLTIFTDNGGGGVYTAPVLPNVSAMRNQAVNFIKAINGEAAPPCPSSEALKDLVFAEEYINFMKRYD